MTHQPRPTLEPSISAAASPTNAAARDQRTRQAKRTFIIEFIIDEGVQIVIERKTSQVANLSEAERDARSWLPELQRRHETTPPNGFHIRNNGRIVLRYRSAAPR